MSIALRMVTFLVVLSLGSCMGRKDAITLPEETLVGAIADAHMAEALLQDERDPGLKDSLMQQYYGLIYELHGIDSSSFHSDLEVLRKDPGLMEHIYSRVLEELARRDAQME